MKRLAWWTPLPPQGSGIADYSARLLTDLRDDFEISAIVASEVEEEVVGPSGVAIVGSDDYRPTDYDLDVYHFGNHAEFHAYMHTPALERPGLLVLHDPALVDFYVNLCGGTRSMLYQEEIRFNCPENLPNWSSKRDLTWEDLDRLELLLSKRLIDASLATLVHSPWAKRRLAERSPAARIEHSWLGADTMDVSPATSSVVTFAVLGGISRHKRVLEVLEAFREALIEEREKIRLVIAGRVDDEAYFAVLASYIAAHQLGGHVELISRLDDDEFDNALGACDVLISLRWPTAGETSSVMMRAFGAGKAIITSEVPQNRDFDERFCRVVSIDLDVERDELVAAIADLGRDPTAVRSAGESARRFVEAEATFQLAGKRYHALIDELIEQRASTRVANSLVASLSEADFSLQGVNAIGNWAAATGLAEAARRAVEALVNKGTPVSVEQFSTGVSEDPRRVSPVVSSRPTGRAFGTDLYFLNINELQLVTDAYMSDADAGRYKIGSWYWELPTLPYRFVAQLRRLDEVWVASDYVRQSFQGEVAVPIQVMPSIVEPSEAPELSRKDLGLPERRCIFFFHFDANSTFARKNPLGLIEAFHRAFPSRDADGPLLVIKTQNLSGLPLARSALEHQMESIGALLIDGELSSDEMTALMCSCDVYASLHRAEGFGLGMAEAMYFNKPVIATAFSGNMEFCTPRNSALVAYTLCQVDPTELSLNPGAELVYEPGALWAEPDLDQAARWMRTLAADSGMRTRLGAAGASTIRAQFNSAVAGDRMSARIVELAKSRARNAATARPRQVATVGAGDGTPRS